MLRKRLLPRWGSRVALSLEPLEVEEWLKALKHEEGLANPTLDKMRRVMSLVYRHSQRYGLIPRNQESNPMRFVRCKTTSEYEAMILSPEQAYAVLLNLQEPERTLTLLAADTGLRISECLGLQWQDVSFAEAVIQVRRTWTCGQVGWPKSKASKGPVPLRPHLAAESAELLQMIARDRTRLMAEAAAKSGVPIHPLRLISELQKILTPDVTVCSDMGSFSMYLCRYLLSFRARQFLITNGQQTLGVALPWAIAATIVRPHEKVLSVSGDGGFLFSSNELETAVRLNSHLVHMIWIDGHYDMVGTQERIKYGRTSGVDFGPVDHVKYAEAFGATGLRIEYPDQIASTLRKAFDTPGPVLIEVHVDYRDNAKLFEDVHEGSVL